MAETRHDHDHHSHMVHNHRDVQGGTARAAVFGVSDGLVSNVALILGVAAAGTEASTVLLAGVSGLLAGAASMAAGEYVSMKAQNELVERELEIERQSLARDPVKEIRELAQIYMMRGLEESEANTLATAVMADPDVALEVHAREELGVDPDSVGNPVGASVSSFIAFAIGAIIPLIPWFLSEGTAARNGSIVLGLLAAAAVGSLLAYFTERSYIRTAGRQVFWAVLACSLTWGIGAWLGATIV
jgi:VIT1/CCC1 family predicted Fe2+/Mn2+ transporter